MPLGDVNKCVCHVVLMESDNLLKLLMTRIKINLCPTTQVISAREGLSAPGRFYERVDHYGPLTSLTTLIQGIK